MAEPVFTHSEIPTPDGGKSITTSAHWGKVSTLTPAVIQTASDPDVSATTKQRHEDEITLAIRKAIGPDPELLRALKRAVLELERMEFHAARLAGQTVDCAANTARERTDELRSVINDFEKPSEKAEEAA